MEEGHFELEVPSEESLLLKRPLLNWLLHNGLDQKPRPVLLHLVELLKVNLLFDVLVELRILDVDNELFIHLVVLVVSLVLMGLLRSFKLEFFVELLTLLLALAHLALFLRGLIVVITLQG